MPLTSYKRWTLRAGVSVDDVRAFVEERIAPAYRRLSEHVDLGLEVDTDGRSILAVQRWTDSAAHRAATSGTGYEVWWATYEPSLTEWDRLVDFDSEWSTFDVDLRDHP